LLHWNATTQTTGRTWRRHPVDRLFAGRGTGTAHHAFIKGTLNGQTRSKGFLVAGTPDVPHISQVQEIYLTDLAVPDKLAGPQSAEVETFDRD
jgi:hypothetical protein